MVHEWGREGESGGVILLQRGGSQYTTMGVYTHRERVGGTVGEDVCVSKHSVTFL